MRPSKMSKAERDLATACGGRHLIVQRNDGHDEKIFVRQLPLRFAETYVELKLAGAEQAVVELCIGKSAHWDKKYHDKHTADIYSVESQTRLLALADELNFPTALQQIERRKNTINGLEGLLKRLYAAQAAMMQEAMQSLMNKLVDSAFSSQPALRSLVEATAKSGTTGASPSSNSPSNNTTSPAASTPSATSTPPPTP